jgi:hypothetical protein
LRATPRPRAIKRVLSRAHILYPTTGTRTSTSTCSLADVCCWLHWHLGCHLQLQHSCPQRVPSLHPPKTREFMCSSIHYHAVALTPRPTLATEVKTLDIRPIMPQPCTPRPTVRYQHLLGATVRTTSLVVRGVVQADVYNLQRTAHDADLTPSHVPDTYDVCNATCMKGTWQHTYSYATIPTAPASVLLRRDPPGWSSSHLETPRRVRASPNSRCKRPLPRPSAAGICGSRHRTMLLLAAHPAPRACACFTVL